MHSPLSLSLRNFSQIDSCRHFTGTLCYFIMAHIDAGKTTRGVLYYRSVTDVEVPDGALLWIGWNRARTRSQLSRYNNSLTEDGETPSGDMVKIRKCKIRFNILIHLVTWTLQSVERSSSSGWPFCVLDANAGVELNSMAWADPMKSPVVLSLKWTNWCRFQCVIFWNPGLCLPLYTLVLRANLQAL